MAAELSEEDWSWAPVREGRIRSGTASVLPSGKVKLRQGAVWIDPTYRDEHAELLLRARVETFGGDKEALVEALLRKNRGTPMKPREVSAALAREHGFEPNAIHGRVASTLKTLLKRGAVKQPARGLYSVG